MWFNPQSTWYLGIWPNETRNLCCFQPTSILGAYVATAEIRLSPIYFCWRLKPTGKIFWTVVHRHDICGNPFCRGGLKKCENPFLLLNVRGLFPNCQNTKFSFVWCVSVWPRQKRDRFSQELVYVDVFPHICTPDVFISHIGYLNFNISLFCQSGGNIASPSHVNHLSGLIKAERLVQTAKTLMPGGFLSLSIPFLSARQTSQLKLYHVLDAVTWTSLPSACASQHRRQRRGELRHWERVRGLREQRRGQFCGQVCCALHWQSLHGERHHPGAHQEPAQHDPR